MIGHTVLRLIDLFGRGRRQLFTLLTRSAFASFGPGSAIELPVRLRNVGNICIGERVTIGSHSWLQTVDIPGAETPRVVIGDRTSAAGFLTVSAVRSVVIDSDVLIARYVYIADHAHAVDDRTKPIKVQGVARVAAVHICSGAWLGQGVVVCPGVTIGRNSVIGANSVVRDDVPDFAVAVGSPARVVRPPEP